LSGRSKPIIAARKVATFVAANALDASAATRSAGAVAGRRPVDAGLGLRLWLRRLSRCLRQLNLRLLNYVIRSERIVVNGNERVITEIRLIVYRHQRVATKANSSHCVFLQIRVIWMTYCVADESAVLPSSVSTASS